MGTVTSFTIDEQLKPAGKIAGLYADLSAKFWDLPHLSPESIELARLALAVMHKAEAEQAERHPSAAGMPQVKIDAVLNESWRKEPTFSVVERAVLDFTEYYYLDPQSIPDEVASKVVDLTGENGLVCLVEALGFIDSRIRLGLIYSSLSA